MHEQHTADTLICSDHPKRRPKETMLTRTNTVNVSLAELLRRRKICEFFVILTAIPFAPSEADEHSFDDLEDMKPYDVLNDDPAQEPMTMNRKAPAHQYKYAKSFDIQIRSGLLPPPPRMFEPESHSGVLRKIHILS
jgi:hypothetical protein